MAAFNSLNRGGDRGVHKRQIVMSLSVLLLVTLTVAFLRYSENSAAPMSVQLQPSTVAKMTIDEQALAVPETARKASPVLLYGVFSVLDQADGRRIIRETWMDDPAVCNNSTARSTSPAANCTMQVVFVIGRVSGDHERAAIEAENSTYGDIVELECAENMNDGKTYSWFSYATTRFSENVSLIGKGDMDTYIYADELSEAVRGFWVTNQTYLYGGVALDFFNCGEWDHCPKKWVYMSGQMYFLSVPLLRWIVDPENHEVRSQITGHEDLTTGRWVSMIKETVIRYCFYYENVPWYHPMKDMGRFAELKHASPRLRHNAI